MAHLTTRQKGGLPSDTMVNPKNNAHVMEIVTRNGRTHGNGVLNLNDIPNKRRIEEKTSGKRKWLDNSNDVVPSPNDPDVEKLGDEEEKVGSEDIPQTVEDDVLKPEESSIISKLQIKIPP